MSAPVEAETAEPTAVPATGGRTPKDMALSLLVLLVPILLAVFGYRAFFGWDAAVTVDPAPMIESAGRASLAPLPGATPDGWQVVSASFGKGVLRIGYLDPDGEGARLVQAKTTIGKLVEDELDGKGEADGETSVGGITWQRWRGPDGQTALARQADGAAVILIGRDADLAGLAATYAR